MYFQRLYVLVLVLVDRWLVFAQNCLDRDLKQCMSELKVLTSNQDLAFAMTETELNLTCRHLRDAMNCVNNFTSRCFDSSQREVYRTLTSGAQELILDLCTPGSTFRKQYLVHAPCYKSLKFEYKKCTEQYSRNQESLKQGEVKNEEKLRKSCCFFDAYQHCTREAVLTKCNEEAADIGEQIVTKAGGPLVQAYCSGFKHGSPDCSLGSSTSSPARVSPLTGIFSILVISISWLLSRP